MSSSHKEHAKQLKAADPIQVRLAQTLDWLLRNTRLITYAMVPLVIAAAGYFGWRYYEKQQRLARVEALGKVQVVYDAELRQAADARQAIMKKVEAIEAKLAPPAAAAAKPGEATAAVPPVPAAAPDPALLVEKAALTKQAEQVKADHKVSRGQFEAYAKTNDATPEGWHAAMTAARLYVEEEQFPPARTLLEGVLAKAKDAPFYQVQARLTLVGVLEELGDFDQALAETGALEQIADKELLPKVLLTRGRLQMLKNAKEDAKATFVGLIENHGTTPEAQKARSIQALLN